MELNQLVIAFVPGFVSLAGLPMLMHAGADFVMGWVGYTVFRIKIFRVYKLYEFVKTHTILYINVCIHIY